MDFVFVGDCRSNYLNSESQKRLSSTVEMGQRKRIMIALRDGGLGMDVVRQQSLLYNNNGQEKVL